MTDVQALLLTCLAAAVTALVFTMRRRRSRPLAKCARCGLTLAPGEPRCPRCGLLTPEATADARD